MMRLACVALAVAMASAEVTVLTSANFKEETESGKLVFVKFYAPWCGHCKAMAPDWEKLGQAANTEKVTIAKIDCTTEEGPCKDHGVNGYPTLKYWTKGSTKPSDYEGGRSLDALQDFVDEQMGGGCGPENKDACSEKEREYLDTWTEKGAKASAEELSRLESLKERRARTPEQAAWYKSRVKLLKQLK